MQCLVNYCVNIIADALPLPFAAHVFSILVQNCYTPCLESVDLTGTYGWKRNDLAVRKCVAGSIGKYIVIMMAEANCLNTGKKASHILLKHAVLLVLKYKKFYIIRDTCLSTAVKGLKVVQYLGKS